MGAPGSVLVPVQPSNKLNSTSCNESKAPNTGNGLEVQTREHQGRTGGTTHGMQWLETNGENKA